MAVKREVKPRSFFLFTRYTHAHHVPHAEHAFTGQQAKWITQERMRKAYPIVFHPIVFHPIV